MIANVIALIFQFFYILMLARVIVSWIRPDPSNPIVRFIINATEPLLAPIRSMLPSAGGLDFSPLIVLLLLSLLQRVVLSML